MKYLSLPTWLLTMLIWDVLPPNHPWRASSRISLENWHRFQTPLCKLHDLLLVVSGIVCVISLYKWIF